jgi:hypothetical protein
VAENFAGSIRSSSVLDGAAANLIEAFRSTLKTNRRKSFEINGAALGR